jgi:hypothetical protein
MLPFSKSPENFVWVYQYNTGGIEGGMPLFLGTLATPPTSACGVIGIISSTFGNLADDADNYAKTDKND